MRKQLLAAGAIVAIAAVAGCGSSSSSSLKVVVKPAAKVSPSPPAPSPAQTSTPAAAAASAVVVETEMSKIGAVLTNAKGRTLYWFALDSAKKSKCSGGCAAYWPPVAGPLKAAAGTKLPHKFGTITRSNGFVQATYDGHPLYTFAADSSAGEVAGNDVSTDGGPWWAMTPSGAKLVPPVAATQPPMSQAPAPAPPPPPPSSAPAPPPSSGGGGYGY